MKRLRRKEENAVHAADPPPPDLTSGNISLFLDFDGTLVDLCPDPHTVAADGLTLLLRETIKRTSLPIAIVTGRQTEIIDRLINIPDLYVSGSHGTEIRLPGKKTEFLVPAVPAPLRNIILEAGMGGSMIVEDKSCIMAAHCTDASRLDALQSALGERLRAGFADYRLWRTLTSVELVHADCSKGTGIRRLMQEPPFAGTTPVYIGDDVGSDMSLGTVHDFGGRLLSVGAGSLHHLQGPSAVKTLLSAVERRAAG